MAKEQKQIIQNLYKNGQNNTFDTDKLKKIEITNKSISFNKNIRKIILLENILLSDSLSFVNEIKLNQEFIDIPEWVIPNIYVYHQIYSNSDFVLLNGASLKDATISGQNFYIWKQNGENHWVLQFVCRNIAQLGTTRFPIYLDLILYFNNPTYYYEI